MRVGRRWAGGRRFGRNGLRCLRGEKGDPREHHREIIRVGKRPGGIFVRCRAGVGFLARLGGSFCGGTRRRSYRSFWRLNRCLNDHCCEVPSWSQRRSRVRGRGSVICGAVRGSVPTHRCCTQSVLGIDRRIFFRSRRSGRGEVRHYRGGNGILAGTHQRVSIRLRAAAGLLGQNILETGRYFWIGGRGCPGADSRWHGEWNQSLRRCTGGCSHFN